MDNYQPFAPINLVELAFMAIASTTGTLCCTRFNFALAKYGLAFNVSMLEDKGTFITHPDARLPTLGTCQTCAIALSS
jgi:hypothetical protein